MHPLSRFPVRLAWALALATTAAFAHAESEREVQARYQQEMAACRSGATSQSLADCQREARAARAEARRHRLQDPPSSASAQAAQAALAANALRRCEVFVDDNRRDCEARHGPQARTEGSVGGGGLLHQATTPAAPR